MASKKYSNNKRFKDPVLVTVIIIVASVALLVVGLGIRYIRSRHAPSDIKSFVLSHYNGVEVVDSQLTQTLTLTPTSCNLVIQKPTQGNFATTLQCSMNAQIWDAVVDAYFSNSLPTDNMGQIGKPAIGPLLLIGVYYNNGTSNTIYFSEPASDNIENFVKVLRAKAPDNNGL